MKSFTPAERYDFNTPAVVNALEATRPFFYNAKAAATIDTIKIVNILRSRELHQIWGVPTGDVEDAYCPVEGYQAYVEATVIRYYS
jgi:hypothetical protein